MILNEALGRQTKCDRIWKINHFVTREINRTQDFILLPYSSTLAAIKIILQGFWQFMIQTNTELTVMLIQFGFYCAIRTFFQL